MRRYTYLPTYLYTKSKSTKRMSPIPPPNKTTTSVDPTGHSLLTPAQRVSAITSFAKNKAGGIICSWPLAAFSSETIVRLCAKAALSLFPATRKETYNLRDLCFKKALEHIPKPILKHRLFVELDNLAQMITEQTPDENGFITLAYDSAMIGKTDAFNKDKALWQINAMKTFVGQDNDTIKPLHLALVCVDICGVCKQDYANSAFAEDFKFLQTDPKIIWNNLVEDGKTDAEIALANDMIIEEAWPDDEDVIVPITL